MAAQRINIHPVTPEARKIDEVVAMLTKGKTVIYPTDTVYGIGCDVNAVKAVEQIARIRDIKPEKASFAIMCADMSHLSEYAKQIDQSSFRLMKACLPGPFTFILHASNKVPKILSQNKKTIGIRISDHPIPQAIIQKLGNPILTASLKNAADEYEYPTDPDDIYNLFASRVDMIIDAGPGAFLLSTIVDLTSGEPVITRQGAGILPI